MFIRVGQIVGSFGIKGQVKVLPLTDFLERFEVGRRLRIGDTWTTVEDAAEHKNQLVLKLSGIKDRTAAEDLQWSYLEASSEERPDLEDDEYLTADLIGLTAVDESGAVLGKVDSVDRFPAHDVLVIGKAMIPAVSEFVREVDLKGGRIVLRPIPGMFDEGDEDVS